MEWRFITRTVFSAFVLLAVSRLASGAPAAAEESPADQEPLRVLVSASVPFFYLDDEGQPAGYEHAVLARFAESLGRPLEVVWFPGAMDGLLLELEHGDVDLAAAAITITPERQERFAFTRGHFPALIVLVERRGEESEKFADLAGKRVVVESGTTYEARLKQIPGVVLVEDLSEVTYEAAFQRVLKKEVDALAVDSGYFLWHADDFPDLTLTLALSERQFYGFALRKDAPLHSELDAFVKELYESGELQALLQDAFGVWGEEEMEDLAEGFLDPAE